MEIMEVWMSTTRREFLHQTLANGALVGLSTLLTRPAFGAEPIPPAQASRKLRILILGGTGFLGPHTVRAAQARGHQLTLFNRGKTNPQLFPDVEKLVGDRYEDISALKGRQWDAVVDDLAYVPHAVTEMAELLKDAVRQYVLISSISVYPNYTKPNMDETAPVATVAPEIVEKAKTHRSPEVMQYYGALKALCEQAAEKVMPGRVTNIRPGLIVGPGDPSDRFTYWPVRVSRGGEVLAPNSEQDFIQFIDARDLGAWIVTCIEKQVVGVYNADRPAASMTMGELLRTSKDVSKSDARFTWVPADFLAEQKVAPWSDMPVWVPATGDDIGFGQVSTQKAAAKGLTHRPAADTVRDTLNWFATLPEERRSKLRAGISAEREQEVLKAWHEHPKE
jgi:2'-hydroxyisoflavone reductase